jgi:predicted acetyltransferase
VSTDQAKLLSSVLEVARPNYTHSEMPFQSSFHCLGPCGYRKISGLQSFWSYVGRAVLLACLGVSTFPLGFD